MSNDESIGAELERIARALQTTDSEKTWMALYAAQQALAWVRHPDQAGAPHDVIVAGRCYAPTALRATDTRAATEDC